jgi:hypothetical protein
MEANNQEKLKKILDFFKENKVELPIDVNNALEDVFNENKEIDEVNIYFKEDADLFEDDLILTNNVVADLKNPSSGSVNNVFTYYGEVDFSLSEFVRLVDGEEVVEEITSIDRLDNPSKLNRESYAVILVENVKWEKGEVTRKPNLSIYCPQNSPDAEESESE